MNVEQVLNALIQLLGKDLNINLLFHSCMRIYHKDKEYKIFFETCLVEKINDLPPYSEEDEFSVWLTNELKRIESEI